MEELFVIVLEFVAELLLELFGSILAELGWRAFVAPFKRESNPYLASVGYVLLGAIAGGLTLLAFPSLFLRSQAGRVANVVVTPVIAGATMAAIGRWRRRRGQRVDPLDRFAYGYLFAFAMAIVRLRFGG